MYNHKGIYLCRKNGQKENTPTVIVNIGDDRKLKWRRRVLTYNHSTHRYKWVVDKIWRHVMHISSGTIVIVNPLDEIPTLHPIIGVMIQYQYGGVIVQGSKFSCAFAFRSVKTCRSYNSNHQLQLEGGKICDETQEILAKFDHVSFHTELKALYNSRFREENRNIMTHHRVI